MVLLLIPFLYLTVSKPFGQPYQTILEVSYLCVLLGITVWEARRKTDEVEVAAARLIASTAAYSGIICSIVFLVVMTHSPVVANYFSGIAESSANDLPPAAAGFGLGALSVILLILVCGIIVCATWYWRAARR